MADEFVLIRLPDGDAEFHAGAQVPAVGERMYVRGADWLVARVDRAPGRVTVTVMPPEVVRDESWPTPYEFLRAR